MTRIALRQFSPSPCATPPSSFHPTSFGRSDRQEYHPRSHGGAIGNSFSGYSDNLGISDDTHLLFLLRCYKHYVTQLQLVRLSLQWQITRRERWSEEIVRSTPD